MPFIAIAVVVMLALGGGVTVAADQSKPGDALYTYKVNVNDNVRHEYHLIRASVGGSAQVNDTTDTNGDVQTNATTSGEVHPGNALRINTDTNGSASSTDGNLNADGSIKVNIY